jgi:hypothetical protein
MAKKMLAVMAMVMVMAASGCGGSGSTNSNPDDSTPAISTPVEEQVLWDDENVKVSFVEIFEYDYLPGNCYLKLKVENKSDKTVMVSLKDSYVNDTAQMMGTGVPIVLAPGKNSQQPFFFAYTNLGITSKSEIKKIEFKVWLMDNATYDTVVETDSLVVEFDN